jgi:UDP-N-acetyl-2-amino-2-deoxyglucuronate dehydrogenase
LHDSHIRFGLKHGADVICEKPIVLNPWNVAKASRSRKEKLVKKCTLYFSYDLHPAIKALEKKGGRTASDKVYEFDLTYITSREAIGITPVGKATIKNRAA